jgi:hypothetical protein
VRSELVLRYLHKQPGAVKQLKRRPSLTCFGVVAHPSAERPGPKIGKPIHQPDPATVSAARTECRRADPALNLKGISTGLEERRPSTSLAFTFAPLFNSIRIVSGEPLMAANKRGVNCIHLQIHLTQINIVMSGIHRRLAMKGYLL